MLKFDINLLFTVINLFALFFIIWKFLFKPVKKIIAKRQEEVDQQYKAADESKAQADAIKAEYEGKINSAKDEQDQIIKEARENAGAEYDRIVGEAKAESERIVAKAVKEAQEQKAHTLLQAKEELADIVSEAAAKISATKENPEADRKLFDDFIANPGE